MSRKSFIEILKNRKKFKKYVKSTKDEYKYKRDKLKSVKYFQEVGEWKPNIKQLSQELVVKGRWGQEYKIQELENYDLYYLYYGDTDQIVELPENIFTGMSKEEMYKLFEQVEKDMIEVVKVLEVVNSLVKPKYRWNRRYIQTEKVNGKLVFKVKVLSFTWEKGLSRVLKEEELELETKGITQNPFGTVKYVLNTEENRKKLLETLKDLAVEYEVNLIESLRGETEKIPVIMSIEIKQR